MFYVWISINLGIIIHIIIWTKKKTKNNTSSNFKNSFFFNTHLKFWKICLNIGVYTFVTLTENVLSNLNSIITKFVIPIDFILTYVYRWINLIKILNVLNFHYFFLCIPFLMYTLLLQDRWSELVVRVSITPWAIFSALRSFLLHTTWHKFYVLHSITIDSEVHTMLGKAPLSYTSVPISSDSTDLTLFRYSCSIITQVWLLSSISNHANFVYLKINP